MQDEGILWSVDNGLLVVELAPGGDGSIPMKRITETVTVDAGPRWDETYEEQRERITEQWSLWDAQRGKIVEVCIGEGITSIPAEAFSGMENLRHVRLPGSLGGIAPRTFRGLSNLESVSISEGTWWIGERAFEGCKALRSVMLPSTLRKVCDSAFSECANLEGIALPQGLNEIGAFAFSGCVSLTSAIIPEGVTKIGGQAFFKCGNLVNVSIPDSATEVGRSAFSSCGGLQEASVPRGMSTQQLDDVFGYYGSGKRVKYRRRSALSGLFGKK